MRILIVEGTRCIRLLLKGVLLDRIPGCEVEEAGNASEALSSLKRVKPDLILTEIDLPGRTNGLALIERARQDGLRALIVIITGLDRPEYRAAATRLGADHFLWKDTTSAHEVAVLVARLTRSSMQRLHTGIRPRSARD
jgi:CheY-like chemotaxis protein